MGVNNKQLGTEFERAVCDIFASRGYWVHFLVPDARGAQPFDVIAVKGGRALAIDCKTCVANTFTMRRLEYNQIMAFEKWIRCGNETPLIVVKHEGKIYGIPYTMLKGLRSIKLGKEYEIEGVHI